MRAYFKDLPFFSQAFRFLESRGTTPKPETHDSPLELIREITLRVNTLKIDPNDEELHQEILELLQVGEIVLLCPRILSS